MCHGSCSLRLEIVIISAFIAGSHVIKIEWDPPGRHEEDEEASETAKTPEPSEHTESQTSEKSPAAASPHAEKRQATKPTQTPVKPQSDAPLASDGIPAWFRESVVYHIQTLGFFGEVSPWFLGSCLKSILIVAKLNPQQQTDAIGIEGEAKP